MKQAATIQMLTPEANNIFQRDKYIKLVAVPVISVAVVNITGFIHNKNYTALYLLLNYLYFIFFAWLIWEGNVRLMIFIKNNLQLFSNKYYKSIIALYTLIIVYTTFIAWFSLSIWLMFSPVNKVSSIHLLQTIIIIVVIAILIANMYEIFYLTGEKEDTANRAEQLNIAKTHAELIALKNHIDPHFIFNSLNTLSYLISKNAAAARLYNDVLAKVYHYILYNRDKDLVYVHEEIEFLSNFFYLLKIRFENSINMKVEINNIHAEELFIPPISLQILLENAIKHNELNEKDALEIYVNVTANFILVKNKIIPKIYSETSTGMGLNNLDNRYKLITGRNVIVYKDDENFIVKLPVVNAKS